MGNLQSYLYQICYPIDTMSQRHSNLSGDRNKEEEKTFNDMKKELIELKLYEEGMSKIQMERCLALIDDSKRCAANHKYKSADYPDLHAGTMNSSSSSSLHDNQMKSPMSSEKNDTESASLDTSAGNMNLWPPSKDNDSSNEGIFNSPKTSSANSNVADSDYGKKNVDTSSSKCSSPGPNRSSDTNARRNENLQEKKAVYNSTRQSKSLDNMNVLNCKKLPNDVPLKPRFIAKPRSKFPVNDDVAMVPKEVLANNNDYLTEIANLAHNWKKKLTCNDFSWGPPIKVNTANRSVDKVTSKEEIPTDSKSSACQSHLKEFEEKGYSLRSTDKSKAIYDYDNSDDDIFKPQNPKSTSKIMSYRNKEPLKKFQSKTRSRETSEEMVVDNKSEYEIIQSDSTEQTNDSPNGRKKARSITPEYPEDSYPRRIVPPLPSTTKSKKRTCASSSRSKKIKASSDNNENKPTKTLSGLSENEIEKSLMTSEDEIKVVDYISAPTKRVNQSIECLKKAKQENEQRKQRLEEEAKLSAAREAHEKKEKAKKRIKEREDNKLQFEAQVKLKKEREDRYRKSHITRSQGNIGGKFQKRTELESEGLRPRTIHFPDESTKTDTVPSQNSPEVDMFPDNEYETASTVESSECPICRKSFSLAEIENHAANCDDFVQDKPKQNVYNNSNASTSNSAFQSLKFRCEVCPFVTPSEEIFKRHFPLCIQSLTNEGSESTQVASLNHSSDDLVLLNSDTNLGKKQTAQSSITNKKKNIGPQNRKRKR